MNKYASRKFLLALAAEIAIIAAALGGEITWSQAIIAIVTAALGYLGVEGAADITSIVKNGGK